MRGFAGDPRAAADTASLLRRAGYPDSANVPLVDLLHRGRSVSVGELADDVVTSLVTAGFVIATATTLEPLVRVSAWDELLIAHDPDRPSEIESETVVGVNNTTRTLAAITPRSPVRRALDVATGPGGLALRLARHSDTVVATDVSERAVAYAAVNAAMNGVHLDLRVGDLFAPVADGETFELITANLPFVVSPDNSFAFRDSGRPRDDLCREAVEGAARLLTDRGTAVLTCNWAVPSAASATDIPVGWTEHLGCSAVVIHHTTTEPEAYAERWNQFLVTQDPAAYDAAVTRWIDAFREWGIDGVASGALVIQRATAARFTKVLTMQTGPIGDGGSQVERMLRNGSWLATRPDDALMSEPLLLVNPHHLEQTMRYDGTWQAEHAAMVLEDSAGVVGAVHPLAVHVLLRLDGATTTGALIDSVAEATGLDAVELRAATIRTCRELLARGCLDRAR